jgi:hypothetical protein
VPVPTKSYLIELEPDTSATLRLSTTSINLIVPPVTTRVAEPATGLLNVTTGVPVRTI